MTKYLKIDEQTINDLSIFGRAGKASVYDLYHRTVSQGGAARLKEMFKFPLSDERLINERAAVFRYFSENEYAFPANSETIGAVAYYLGNDDVRSQLQPGGQSIGQWMKDMVALDAAYVFVRDGIQACL